MFILRLCTTSEEPYVLFSLIVRLGTRMLILSILISRNRFTAV